MIDLYFWTTDNGYKARHMMEESGLNYTIKPIDLKAQEQFDPDYLKISPHHKIPAIVDHDGPNGETITLFESGAILKYVGSKMVNRLYPDDIISQTNVDQWLFFGSAQFTTIAQQYGFFMVRSAVNVPEAKRHYGGLMKDMFSCLDLELLNREYIAGDYSIADISMYSDVRVYGVDKYIGFDNYPNLKRWFSDISQRSAVHNAWGPF
tara:strand:+ start:186 stop:806 length:621 start_codon:yes stop_codon:yes gene_type:complete